MAKSRLRSLLSRIIDIKPGEELIAVSLFLYFFFITSPYYIIKSLRNASYLNRLGDEKLPLAYFLTAVLMGFIVNFHSRLQVKLPRSRLITSSLVFFFSNIVLFWWLFEQRWEWVPVVFWVWANIFAIVLVTQFWILVNDVFNPREAKRLIGFIGSGAQLGAILGGVLAGTLAKGAPGLLLPLAAAMLGMGILVVSVVFRRQRKKAEESDSAAGGEAAPSVKVGFRDAFQTTKQSRYLLLLAGIMTVTLIVSTLIDWQFNSVVDSKVLGSNRENSLTSFFGYFNAGTMAFAFLFQLLLTSPLIRAFGIRLTLLLYPLILFLGAGGIGAAALVGIVPLIPAILIKASDKSLAYSLNQSVRELLYIPISPEQKYKSKIFIDMFLNRFAKGLGAIILLVLLFFVRKGGGSGGAEGAIQYISAVVLALIIVWIFLNLRIGREYADVVKSKIEKQYERGDRLVDQRLDVDYTKRVFDTLESKNRSSVLYAMNLFDLIRQDKLTPEVKKLISYKSDEVRAASLGGLFEQSETGLGPRVEDELSEEVLKKEVLEIMNLDVYQEAMKDHFEKMVVDKGLDSLTARMEAAKAIGFMEPQAPLVEKLENLLEDESCEVSRYAIQSAAVLKRRQDVPTLVNMLQSAVLREDAAAALRQFGPRIVGMLADYLVDKSEDPELRKSVASVLAGIGIQDAVDFLSWELAGAEEIADEIIDALDRIRSSDTRIRFAKELIMPRIFLEIQSYCWRLVEPDADRDGEGETAAQTEKGLADSLWNVFKLLGLVYSREDIIKAYQNLKTGTKDSVAYALELLDNVLQKEIRDIIFPLVEDLSSEEKMKRCRHVLANLRLKKERDGQD
ncbi:MAG: MFS transporter [Candidatus Aminicenantes bacterium]|nr:MFS transporter [Candidatus Aminicenantes bacterium]